MKSDIQKLQNAVRNIPDFPKPGILFRDITPILNDPELFKIAVNIFANQHKGVKVDKIAAIEARGFLFAGAVSYKLGAGLVPIRKKGKLPYKTFEESYQLEYGTAELAVHQDAFQKGENVILIDDLLATGGTALAGVHLIERAGGKVVGIDFLIELTELNGRAKLSGYNVFAAIKF
jgi:adenine phosphoribosyltransferase